MEELARKKIKNYSDDVLSVMNDTDSHANGSNGISLSIVGLDDIHQRTGNAFHELEDHIAHKAVADDDIRHIVSDIARFHVAHKVDQALFTGIGQQSVALGAEVIHSLLADGQHGGILVLDLGLDQLEDVAVVAAGQTFIGCKYNETNSIYFSDFQQWISRCSACTCYQSGKYFFQFIFVWTSGYYRALRTTQLRSRYHFHRFCDFTGTLNTADPSFYFLTTSQTLFTTLSKNQNAISAYAWKVALNSVIAFTRASSSAPSSLPVLAITSKTLAL